MEKELSISEINNIVKQVRHDVENHADGKALFVDISSVNTKFGDEIKHSKALKKKSDESIEPMLEAFDKEIDYLLNDVDVIMIYVELRAGNGRSINKFRIPTGRKINETPLYVSLSNPEERTIPQPQQPTTQPQNVNGTINKVLRLMGFEGASLNGFEDDELGGLGAVMAVREQNLRNEFARKDDQRRYEELLEKKIKLENENEALKKELKDEKDYSEKLEGEIEELEEQVEELEKLKPEKSLAGVSLVGAGIKIVESLAKKHASFVGGLAGMNADEFKQMLENDDKKAIQQQIQGEQVNEVNDVEIEQVDDERSQKIAEIDKFLKSLSDEEFSNMWQLMGLFYQDKSQIAKIINALTTEANVE